MTAPGMVRERGPTSPSRWWCSAVADGMGGAGKARSPAPRRHHRDRLVALPAGDMIGRADQRRDSALRPTPQAGGHHPRSLAVLRARGRNRSASSPCLSVGGSHAICLSAMRAVRRSRLRGGLGGPRATARREEAQSTTSSPPSASGACARHAGLIPIVWRPFWRTDSLVDGGTDSEIVELSRSLSNPQALSNRGGRWPAIAAPRQRHGVVVDVLRALFRPDRGVHRRSAWARAVTGAGSGTMARDRGAWTDLPAPPLRSTERPAGVRFSVTTTDAPVPPPTASCC